MAEATGQAQRNVLQVHAAALATNGTHSASLAIVRLEYRHRPSQEPRQSRPAQEFRQQRLAPLDW